MAADAHIRYDESTVRAFVDLERRLLERLSTRVIRSTFGVAYLDDDYPTRYYSNFLLVDLGPPDATAELLIADADDGLADRRHRRILIRDGELARALAPRFRQQGFEASREVAMVRTRRPDRPGALEVEELPFHGVSSLILETYREDPTSSLSVNRLFTQQHEKFQRVIGARFFAARVDRELAGLCELHEDAGEALVENVVTLVRYRGRGVARAVVLRSVEVAQDEGARHVFIVADDDDWPKDLYMRLGFDPIAVEWTFTKTP